MDKAVLIRAVLRLVALLCSVLAAFGFIPDDVAPAIEARLDETAVALLALSEAFFWAKGKKQ